MDKREETQTGYWAELQMPGGNTQKCIAIPHDDRYYCIIIVDWANDETLEYIIRAATDGHVIETGMCFIFAKADEVTLDSTPLRVQVIQAIPKRYVDRPYEEYHPVLIVNGKVLFGQASATRNELTD